MEDPQAHRPRQPPGPRVEGPQHRYDLAAVAARLKGEPGGTGPSGRRQETLYKRGPISVALFVFDRDAHFPPHKAKGVVTIHVLKGHLRVTAEGHAHDLHSGGLLVLAPGVEHDVAAPEESHMLLTVNLEAAPAGNAPA